MVDQKRKQLLYDMEHHGAGEAAMATVLTSKVKHHAHGAGEGESAVGSHDSFRLRMQVEPDGGAPFEADVSCTGPGVRQPLEGEQLPVRYDPGDPETVVLDLAKFFGDRSEARDRRKASAKAGDTGPDPVIIEQLKELQARFDRGEMPEGAFRVERAKILGG